MERIKIVIVDDEVVSRNMLKSYLEDNHEFELVGDFAEGMDAVRWIRENRVDIILCDMNMPQIDGVELISMIRKIYEDIQFVAISGYDSFDYVRGCMIHSVADYLLKHELTKEKLLQVLEQVKQKNNMQPVASEIKSRAGFLITKKEEFTTNHIQHLVDIQAIDFDSSYMVPIIISPDYNPLHTRNVQESKQKIIKMMVDIVGQILGTKYKYMMYITPENHLQILLSFTDVKSYLYILSTANSFCKKMSSRVERMLDLTITQGIGSICVKLEDVLTQCVRLNERVCEKLYLGGNVIFTIDGMKKIEYGSFRIPTHIKGELRCEVENLQEDSVFLLLEDLFEQMRVVTCGKEDLVAQCKELLKLIKKDEHKYLDNLQTLETFEQFKEWIKEQYKEVLDQRKERNQNQFSPTIIKVIEFLEEHYPKDISLEECAAYVNTSYTHLSRIFKKETGQRFVEYLNKLRVNKAKALLVRGESSMKEIVELVGFRNYNYFFKVFREIEGSTPNEFIASKKM